MLISYLFTFLIRNQYIQSNLIFQMPKINPVYKGGSYYSKYALCYHNYYSIPKAKS